MIVRPATPSDLSACQLIDTSYKTWQVWQMRMQRGDVMAEGEEGLFVGFRPVRLPRPIILTPPAFQERLTAGWQRRALTLVLDEESEVLGYIGVEVHQGQRLGWVDVMAVSPNKRRQGWGTQLIQDVLNWSRSRGLRALVLELQARNAPAITLALQLGFGFSGYHEQYYEESDVALFFTFPLE